MDEIIKYVQNQLVQTPFRLKSYVQNEQNADYPERNIFSNLDKYLSDFLHNKNIQNRWIIIPGLRGVGKTTIMAQLYFKHYKESLYGRMLYISVDEIVNVLGSSLKEVLFAYEKILGETFEKLSVPIFIFIDEVQYDKKWASILKSVFDRSHKVFIVCSGSSAVSLQTNPDIVRRSIFKKLFPTTFSEFLMIRDNKIISKNIGDEIKNYLFHSKTAKDVYQNLKKLEKDVLNIWAGIDKILVDEYLKIGTLPFAIKSKDETFTYQTINLLLDRVINQDVQGLGRFDINTLSNIKRILFLIAESDLVSIQKLSSVLNLSINTISNVLEILEKAEILIRVMPYGPNSKKVRKPSRYQFMSSAMKSALLSVASNEQIFTAQKGRLLEDVVALVLHQEFVETNKGSLNYDSAKSGADFILTILGESLIPIEIGIGEKPVTQIKNTMEKIKLSKYGLIICKTPLSLSGENIVKVPLDYFLLI